MTQNLKKMAGVNIFFVRSVKNNELRDHFEKNDFLVLPSHSEPWGLAVEEALYHGLPVMISHKCGCADLVKHGKNGYLFYPTKALELKELILSIDNKSYKYLQKHSQSESINLKDAEQVNAYLI